MGPPFLSIRAQELSAMVDWENAILIEIVHEICRELWARAAELFSAASLPVNGLNAVRQDGWPKQLHASRQSPTIDMSSMAFDSVCFMVFTLGGFSTSEAASSDIVCSSVECSNTTDDPLNFTQIVQ